MNKIVTMNEAGWVELPAPVRRRFQLKGRSRLEMEVTATGITLRPRRSPTSTKVPTDAVSKSAQLVRRGPLLVATGFPPGANIAAAIQADRDEREVTLAAPFQPRKSPLS